MCIITVKVLHSLHIGLGVFVHDDVHRRWEETVAPNVIAVCVGINDANDRLVRHGSYSIQQQLTPATQLRINKCYAVRTYEDANITTTKLISTGTTATNDVKIPLYSLNLRGLHGRRIQLLLSKTDRETADNYQRPKCQHAFHVCAP